LARQAQLVDVTCFSAILLSSPLFGTNLDYNLKEDKRYGIFYSAGDQTGIQILKRITRETLQ
jgi:hypothetical protein